MFGRNKRSLVLAMLAVSMLSADPRPALAEYGGSGMVPYEPSAESMIADVLVARPAGFGATVIGALVFVISLPFSGPSGNAQQAAQMLVVQPAQFTFNRPLGEFAPGY
jgi:hypothetical protein